MRFDKHRWVRCLEASLKGLSLDHGFDIFMVEVGPIQFQLVLEKESSFQDAIQAFYSVRPEKNVCPSRPVIFCLDDVLAQELISKAGSEMFFYNHFQENKCYQEKVVIMSDRSRSIMRVYDAESGIGLFACENFKHLPPWEFFSPLKEFIHLIALQSDCWLVHGAALSLEGEGFLLVGPGHSGKSSLTLSLMDENMNTAGDDYVCVSSKGHVFSIYRTIKHLGDSFRKSLARLDGFRKERDQVSGKRVYFCNKAEEKGPFVDAFQLKNIYGVALSADTSEKMSVSPNLAFNYFFMSTVSQIPLWVDRSMRVASLIFKNSRNFFVVLRNEEDSHQAFIDLLELNHETPA